MKKHYFFAYLNRMKYIERWSLMRSTTRENIMEHSEQVAQLAHILAVINNKIFKGAANIGEIVISAVYHEASEVITGDLPTPIKYYNADINSAYKNLEDIANKKLVGMLPEDFRHTFEEILISPSDETKRFVKAADKLAAYIKCIEEVKIGNSEFIKAKATIYKELIAYNMPEIEYFLQTFIEGFEKTLDELE
ncbi:MAG: 5'-deoxynucleotidase [Clostridia bacterium]|nr:5'-deoxynucleotidase [Clostridia bacterium]